MQNLPKDMEFLGRILATVEDKNPYRCALIRAVGGEAGDLDYVERAQREFGWSAAKCMGIAAGWDDAQGVSYMTVNGKPARHNIMESYYRPQVHGSQEDFDAGKLLGERAARLCPIFRSPRKVSECPC